VFHSSSLPIGFNCTEVGTCDDSFLDVRDLADSFPRETYKTFVLASGKMTITVRRLSVRLNALASALRGPGESRVEGRGYRRAGVRMIIAQGSWLSLSIPADRSTYNDIPPTGYCAIWVLYYVHLRKYYRKQVVAERIAAAKKAPHLELCPFMAQLGTESRAGAPLGADRILLCFQKSLRPLTPTSRFLTALPVVIVQTLIIPSG
jgi:hypothetical protein